MGWTSKVDATIRHAELWLNDDQGEPVTGANVTLYAFHKARASQAVELTLDPVAPGHYRVVHPFKRPGLWEFRIAADTGPARFVERTELEIF